tara:strand:- start:272 stop:610 length:339 start_codon:yes stop_codon:yes gene_type:complete
MQTKLGKISSVKFGIGGYQDACIGITVSLDLAGGSGVQDNNTAWDSNLIKCTDHCNWTEKDRDDKYAEIMRYVSDLLSNAKVKDVSDLKGVPIEATFDGMTLKSWRILTEVI